MKRSPFDNVPEEISRQIADFSKDATDISAKDLEQQIGGEALASTTINPTQVGFRGQMGQGVDNRALADAVNRRALRQTRVERQGIEQNIESTALQMKMNRLQQAAKLTGAELQENRRAEMNRYIRRQQRKQARAGVLGNVLGIAGAVAGGLMGGGGGAAAGYAIGAGAGNVIGSQ